MCPPSPEVFCQAGPDKWCVSLEEDNKLYGETGFIFMDKERTEPEKQGEKCHLLYVVMDFFFFYKDYHKMQIQPCFHFCSWAEITPSFKKIKHTFWRRSRTGRSNLPHATPMAAKCHQLGNNSCLPKSHISNNNSSPGFCLLCILQLFLYGLKQPVSSDKHWVRCYTWHFK